MWFDSTCRVLGCLVLALVGMVSRGTGEEASQGIAARRLQMQLEQPMTANWTNQAFNVALAGLAKTQQLAIVLDRRIDPAEPLTLSVIGDSVGLTLQRIAEKRGIGVSIFGPVVYFGPTKSATILRTLAELRRDDIAKLPGTNPQIGQARPMTWNDLAEPRELIAQLAKEGNVEIANSAAIPHDLWPANKLPALPWFDRLTLLAIQFDLTFEFSSDGSTLRLVPIPEQVVRTKLFPVGDDPVGRAKKLTMLVPEAKVELRGARLAVTGRAEDHENVGELISGKKVRTTSVKSGREVYTLTVEGIPLDKVLGQLSKMLKLEVRLDSHAIAKAKISMEQPVSFKVENASLHDLVDAAFKNTGLAFQLKDKTLTVQPR